MLDPVGFSGPSSSADAPLDPRNLRRRALGSWALYDLANTIWSYGIFSYAIGLYLTSDAVLGPSAGNLWLQIAIAVSVGLNALLSPAIGAISDRAGRRLPYLFTFTLLAIIPAMLIPGMPVSVATRKLRFGDAWAKLIIFSVERIWVRPLPNAMHWLAQPHSGWTSSSVAGSAVRAQGARALDWKWVDRFTVGSPAECVGTGA